MNKIFKLLITSLICISIMVAIIPRAKVVYDLSMRKADLEEQKLRLIEKNQALTLELEKTTSPQYIEKIAREQLGLVKEGEQIIMPARSNKN